MPFNPSNPSNLFNPFNPSNPSQGSTSRTPQPAARPVVDTGKARFGITGTYPTSQTTVLTATVDSDDPDGRGPTTYRWYKQTPSSKNWVEFDKGEEIKITNNRETWRVRLKAEYTDGNGNFTTDFDEEAIGVKATNGERINLRYTGPVTPLSPAWKSTSINIANANLSLNDTWQKGFTGYINNRYRYTGYLTGNGTRIDGIKISGGGYIGGPGTWEWEFGNLGLDASVIATASSATDIERIINGELSRGARLDVTYQDKQVAKLSSGSDFVMYSSRISSNEPAFFLDAGAGDDYIDALISFTGTEVVGSSNATITGGAGKDTFRLFSQVNEDDNKFIASRMNITDFEVGVDVVRAAEVTDIEGPRKFSNYSARQKYFNGQIGTEVSYKNLPIANLYGVTASLDDIMSTFAPNPNPQVVEVKPEPVVVASPESVVFAKPEPVASVTPMPVSGPEPLVLEVTELSPGPSTTAIQASAIKTLNPASLPPSMRRAFGFSGVNINRGSASFSIDAKNTDNRTTILSAKLQNEDPEGRGATTFTWLKRAQNSGRWFEFADGESIQLKNNPSEIDVRLRVEYKDGQGNSEKLTSTNDVLVSAVEIKPPAVQPVQEVPLISESTDPITLFGAATSETLSGKGGNDRLFGMDGDDTIFGNKGDDIIDGGKGDNILWGGDGKDQFVINPYIDGVQTIKDFVDGQDSIKLSMFGQLSLGLTQVGNDVQLSQAGQLAAIVENTTVDQLQLGAGSLA